MPMAAHTGRQYTVGGTGCGQRISTERMFRARSTGSAGFSSFRGGDARHRLLRSGRRRRCSSSRLPHSHRLPGCGHDAKARAELRVRARSVRVARAGHEHEPMTAVLEQQDANVCASDRDWPGDARPEPTGACGRRDQGYLHSCSENHRSSATHHVASAANPMIARTLRASCGTSRRCIVRAFSSARRRRRSAAQFQFHNRLERRNACRLNRICDYRGVPSPQNNRRTARSPSVAVG
jgi:hypothetical protein